MDFTVTEIVAKIRFVRPRWLVCQVSFGGLGEPRVDLAETYYRREKAEQRAAELNKGVAAFALGRSRGRAQVLRLPLNRD